MAIGNIGQSRSSAKARALDINPVAPVSMQTDWIDINTQPETADISLTNPSSITKSEQNKLTLNGLGTSLQIRLKYDDGISAPTNPVVIPVGFDGNNCPQKLRDSDGESELEIPVDVTNDLEDGTFKYTDFVEVDMDGSTSVMVLVKTAFNGTGTKTNSCIQVRVK